MKAMGGRLITPSDDGYMGPRRSLAGISQSCIAIFVAELLLPSIATKLQPQHQLFHGCHGNDIGLDRLGRADEDRRVARFLASVRQAAVTAFDDPRIEPNHVHVVTEAEHLLREPRGDLELRHRECWIDEELHWVVTGLAMDIDGPRVIGSECIIEPKVIRGVKEDITKEIGILSSRGSCHFAKDYSPKGN